MDPGDDGNKTGSFTQAERPQRALLVSRQKGSLHIVETDLRNCVNPWMENNGDKRSGRVFRMESFFW